MELFNVPEPMELIEHIRFDHNLEKLVSELRAKRHEAERLAKESAEKTSVAAIKLAKAGFSRRDVGELLGVSFQRAQQLVK